MKTIRDYKFVSPADKGASVAIGNFDGVHLGHMVVIERARETATKFGVDSGVLTFEPHPRELFQPDADPFRLMSSETRAHRLEKLGLDCLYEIGFTQGLAQMTADEFAREVISEGLGLTHVVVGEDFRFGKGREGDAQMLERLGMRYGFGVSIAELMHLDVGEVSSTAIREALSEGRTRDAAKMLGHWHRVDGPVIQGDQRGRDLGYPTINMSIEGLHPPKFGVYAVQVDVLSGPHKGLYQGAASIGVRPTFGINTPNIETYLFDFQGDLYGAEVSVALVRYLRSEEKFDNLEALISQMDSDVSAARKILADL